MATSPAFVTEKGLRHRAEALAATLPPLLVAAERIAATVAQGVHGRRRVGAGDAFWQFRRYHPGDALGQIDWRQSGKSQALFVRQNEWAAAESVWLWSDASASMDYCSEFSNVTKRGRAELLVLALAALLVRGGERVAMMGEGQRPTTGRKALEHLAQYLIHRRGAHMPRSESAGSLSLPPTPDLPRFSHVVLVGDFLSPQDEIQAMVQRLAESGVNGLILQILDPAEEDFPFSGRTHFHGPENEGDLMVGHAPSLRSAYIQRLQERRATLHELCRRHQWRFLTHRTDRSAQTALLALYGAISGELAK